MKINKGIKNFILFSGITLTSAFAVMSIVAKKKKPSSVYDDKPEEKNPFEGKKVIFVPSEADVENADGVKGHLKSVGDTEYKGSFYDKYGKRALDVFLSGMGLIILSPVFAGISLAIKIDDPGPVLFTQKRVGKNKQYFKLHKFRSMKMSTPHDVPTHMLDNPESYITKVGKFLRKHSLDELPQIWDIFIGNMSVIGPRPALWNQDVLTAERDKYNANDIKPGLTGWAQINGRDELEILDKARLDGEYTEKESLKMDAKCFMGSLGVFRGDSSVVEGGTGEMKKHASGDKKNNVLPKKKILVVCQYYFPEPFRLTDYCEQLVKDGYEVTVLTGIPNYPEGITYKGYEKGKRRDEVVNGVYVHRCFTIPRKTGPIFRLLNYLSYSASSSIAIEMNKVKPVSGGEFDIVLVNQLSPVMMAQAGITYKKIHHKKLVLYCLDLWPDSLTAGGISKNSKIYKLFFNVSKRIYKSADLVLVTSQSFTEYLSKNFLIDQKRVKYLPQFAEGIFNDVKNADLPDELKKYFGKTNFVFAGNIGEIQSVETIVKAAEQLQNQENIHFHIVGSGTDLDRLRNIVDEKHLTNISFYGRRPLNEMPSFYAFADAMLVTLSGNSFISLTLPGKVQTYMAAGKPIIGAINGEANFVIQESSSGFVGNADDDKQLVKNIIAFVKLSKQEQQQLGLNSRKYYETKFSRESFMSKLESYL